MSPGRALEYVQALGGAILPLRVVGCEPGVLGSEEEPNVGLSCPVAAATSQAISLIQSLIEDFRSKWSKKD